MTTVRWGAVVDGLVSALVASGDYVRYDTVSDGSKPIIFDGPEYGLDGDYVGAWLCVGWSGDPDNPEDSGTFKQSVASGGKYTREEIGVIKGIASAQSGDTDMKTVRDQALSILADLENLVRNTPTAGLSPAWMIKAEIESGSIAQFFEQGSVCRVPFQIAYLARI